jgi:protein SCO1/2
MEQFFNVGVTGSDSTLMHSLSTVLIGPDGKIQQWFPGNDWAPSQVIQQMQKSAGIIS